MNIFLDASALIHASQDSPDGIRLANEMATDSDRQFLVSPLVRMESLVRPLRTGNVGHMRRRLELIRHCKSLPIDDYTYELATHIRVAHGLSTPDAIHLAVAGQHKCDQIITSDKAILRAAPGFAVNIPDFA